jgi:hypothetical protein
MVSSDQILAGLAEKAYWVQVRFEHTLPVSPTPGYPSVVTPAI